MLGTEISPVNLEPTLVDVFEEVMTFVDEGKSRRRATHAIRRLRDQRTLSRVDHAGVVRRGEFALTRLGTAIADRELPWIYGNPIYAAAP